MVMRKALKLLLSYLIGTILLFLATPLLRLYAELLVKHIFEPLSIYAMNESIQPIVIATIAAIPITATMLIVGYIQRKVTSRKETVKKQISRIEEIQTAITDASTAVRKLQGKIAKEEKTYELLKNKREILKEVIGKNKRELEKILSALEFINKGRRRKEMIVSFVLGILASLISMYIWVFIE